MPWLQSLDLAVFRWINRDWASPWLDPVMEFLSGNALLWPTVAVVVLLLWLKGARRGRIFCLVLAFTLAVGDPLLVGNLKQAIGRPRPFVDHPETRLLVGRGTSFAMPSGHSAIWGAVTAVTLLYYRRRGWVVLPVGIGVGLSRCYLGVHYPTDVLAGWALGAGYGVVLSRMAAWLWDRIGRVAFPLWWQRLPDLREPERGVVPAGDDSSHWTRLGWLWLGGLLVLRWVYIGSGTIELSEDEAYQWLWSKQLALSYYSKPPLIAYLQWIGTHLLGDRELGVRFLPPLLGAGLGLILQRFMARLTDARTGFVLIVALQAVPMLAVGSILMTIDPPTVFFCTLGVLAAWRAITEDSTGWWVCVGLAWAGGFLSKYFAPFQIAGTLLGLAVIPGAWRQLRRPGPWLALGVLALSTLPVLVWNAQHGWITVTHLGERGGLSQEWKFNHFYLRDFLISVPPLLNPVFLGLAIAGSWAIWRRPAPVLERYLWVTGAPILLFYFAYTLRARVQPNWVAGSLVPLALFTTLHWYRRSQAGARVGGWVVAGLLLGLPLVGLLHNTNLIAKLVGRPLPVKFEPMKRVRGNREFAEAVGVVQKRLEAEGKPVFLIADHYGRAGLLSFYLPDAKAAAAAGGREVFVLPESAAKSQFALWPGYGSRRGENALFVRRTPEDPAEELPAQLRGQFERIDPPQAVDITYRGRLFHQYQVFACRNLR